MVNPGNFSGLHREFLASKLECYIQAVVDQNEHDVMLDILRQYFNRFDPTKGPHHQPTAEEMEAVDDDAPAREIPRPDRRDLTEDAYERELKEYDSLMRWIKHRKEVSAFQATIDDGRKSQQTSSKTSH
jgi:hypothetical protein